MGKANKWVGGGRTGDSASGGSKVNGSNKDYAVPKKVSGPRGPGAPNLRIEDRTRLGVPQETRAISSHNNIDTFLKGAKSRGPYGGPSFRSLNNMEDNYKMPTPSSKFKVPSAGGSGSSRKGGYGPGSLDKKGASVGKL